MKPTPLVIAAAILLYGAWRARRGRLSRAWAVIGALVAAAAIVYGTGLVHPPSLEHVLRSVGTTLGPWTYLLVGGLAFLETGAFIGLVAPGETAILLGGFVAGQGKINVIVLIAVVWAAAVGGDLVSYLLGRRLGREFLLEHGPKVKITEERLERVEEFFKRHGGPAILLGRFVGLIRAVLPFIAGASRLPLRRFIPFDAVGAGLWGGGLVLLGYAFWQSFDQITRAAHTGLLALGTVIVVVAGGVWAVKKLRDPESRERIEAYMEARPALRPFLRAARALARHLRQPYAIVTAAAAAVTLVGVVGFAVAVAAAGSGGPTALDGDAFDFMKDIRSGGGVHIAKVITAAGTIPVVTVAVVLAAAFLVWRSQPVAAAAIVVAVLVDEVALHVAKAAVGRPRPSGALVETSGSSLPSGHTATSVVYLAIVAVVARNVRSAAARTGIVIAGILVAVLIGLSRVYLRAHYLTDVLAGWGLGLAIFGAIALATLTVERVRHNEARA